MGQAMFKYKPLPKKVEYSNEENEILIFYKSYKPLPKKVEYSSEENENLIFYKSFNLFIFI